jgi:RNA polymerase sigma factor (TIGR02999 family)
MSESTELLTRLNSGDRQALDELWPLIYDELHRIAAARLAREPPGQTLQATALVHEAWLRLVGSSEPRRFQGRGHFLAAAATAMRRIVIDNARRRQAEKRGGHWIRQPLDAIAAPQADEELLALDEALQQLAEQDSLKARLVELRYFVGLTGDEAAEALGISPSAADRHWTYARAWLQTKVRGD